MSATIHLRSGRGHRRSSPCWLLFAAISCSDDSEAATDARDAAASVADAATAAEEGVVRAVLQERPEDFPSESVRAALVWIDGRPLDGPETTSPDDLRKLRYELNSDVPIEVRFPLMLRIAIEPMEPMHYEWLAFLGVSDTVRSVGEVRDDRFVYSMPHAEVVVYHDANHNQRLDLLEPGMPGPAPDRVLAVSSGRDADDVAVRNVVVNKRSPFEPPLELFVQSWGSEHADDGLYLVHIFVAPELPLAQEALLSTHGITMSSTFDKYWVRNMAQRDFVYRVESLRSAEPVPLFAVTEARESWLARGCVPYPTGRLGYAQPPPEGAAVHCGADRLSYASNPDNYCGQSDTLTRIDWQGDPDLSWWPCDEHGLKPESPYVASSEAFGTSVLSIHTGKAYTEVAFYEPPIDFRCRPDIIYDFDHDPKTHLPAHPPPPGSQVRCYGRDALSFIPRDPDCQRKFTYDLSSEDIPGYRGEGAMQWDLREQPPAWWPCDEEGKLQSDSPYEAPHTMSDDQACPDAPSVTAPSGDYPPPPHSKVRCISATSLIAVPLWSDHCDGRTETALSGKAQTAPIERAGWEQPAPDGWPCDAEGMFKPMPGYEPL